MKASRGLKWENKMYKLKRSIASSKSRVNIKYCIAKTNNVIYMNSSLCMRATVFTVNDFLK